MSDKKDMTEICENYPKKIHISPEFAEEIETLWLRKEWSALRRKLFKKLAEWDNTHDHKEQCPGCRSLIIDTHNIFSSSKAKDGEELSKR